MTVALVRDPLHELLLSELPEKSLHSKNYSFYDNLFEILPIFVEFIPHILMLLFHFQSRWSAHLQNSYSSLIIDFSFHLEIQRLMRFRRIASARSQIRYVLLHFSCLFCVSLQIVAELTELTKTSILLKLPMIIPIMVFLA